MRGGSKVFKKVGQFSIKKYNTQLLNKEHGIAISMNGKGRSIDNIAI
ncbi:MAG: hypothetical protein IE881_08100 [Epsilonproteobacteria bacterium]|nr:hypothetical protein [Campylobacterota bacterium]